MYFTTALKTRSVLLLALCNCKHPVPLCFNGSTLDIKVLHFQIIVRHLTPLRIGGSLSGIQHHCTSGDPRQAFNTTALQGMHFRHPTIRTAFQRIHVRHPTPLRFRGSTSGIQHRCASGDPRQASNTAALQGIHVRHPTPLRLRGSTSGIQHHGASGIHVKPPTQLRFRGSTSSL